MKVTKLLRDKVEGSEIATTPRSHSRLPRCGPFLAVLLAWTLTGCSYMASGNYPNPTPTPHTEYLYATSAVQTMSFALTPSTGKLAARPAISTSASLGITANITTDPTSKFLFVPDLSNTSINVLAIDAGSGSLSAVRGSPFSVGSIGAGSLAIDPGGRYLYAADASGVKAFAFNNATGTLAVLPNSPFSDGASAIALAMHPSGRFVYAAGANSSNTTVSGFSIDSGSGVLSPLPDSPFSAVQSSPLGLAIHPSGRFLYATDGNSITIWNIDTATGAIAIAPGSPFPNRDPTTLLMLIDPTGRFLYQPDQNGSISGFVIDSISGRLTAISGSPFAVGTGSVDLAIDPSGAFLYAATPTAIRGFSIDPGTGMLTEFSGSPFPSSDPNLITIVKIPK